MARTQFRFGELRAVPDDADESRTVEFVISNETRDRHGTVLRADKWKLDNYKRNPVVSYNHSIHGGLFESAGPDTVIGKSDVFLDGNQLIGRVTFEPGDINPLAEKIFQKVKFGTLRMASVGFVPTGEPEWGRGEEAKGKPNATQYFPGQELLEWSIVNIPSNPTAAKRAFEDDLESFFDAAAEVLEGKYEPEDLRKMTITGLLGVLSNEGVEKDIEERIVEEDAKMEEDGVDDVKRKKVLAYMKTIMAYHNDFEPKLQRMEKQEKEKREKETRRMYRDLNQHYNKSLKEE